MGQSADSRAQRRATPPDRGPRGRQTGPRALAGLVSCGAIPATPRIVTAGFTDGPWPLLGWVAIAVLLLSVGLWLGWRLAALRRARLVARSRRAGLAGEARAEALLAGAGYRIERRQPTARGVVHVDGVAQAFTVRADFLVTRRRRRYVVEAKGTVGAASVAHRDTRRQLLEYARVFDVDGVLLVDAEGGQVHTVTFG